MRADRMSADVAMGDRRCDGSRRRRRRAVAERKQLLGHPLSIKVSSFYVLCRSLSLPGLVGLLPAQASCRVPPSRFDERDMTARVFMMRRGAG